MEQFKTVCLGLSLLISYGLSCYIADHYQSWPLVILLGVATYRCNDLDVFKYID